MHGWHYCFGWIYMDDIIVLAEYIWMTLLFFSWRYTRLSQPKSMCLVTFLLSVHVWLSRVARSTPQLHFSVLFHPKHNVFGNPANSTVCLTFIVCSKISLAEHQSHMASIKWSKEVLRAKWQWDACVCVRVCTCACVRAMCACVYACVHGCLRACVCVCTWRSTSYEFGKSVAWL